LRTVRDFVKTIVVVAFPLLIFSGCARGIDPQRSLKFQQAQKVFDEADSPEEFLTAAALYQEILDGGGGSAGYVSGAVLYNQGNALMRAGRRGEAIVAYRRAKPYRPRDPYLEANLRYALGNQNPAARRPLIEYLLFWQDWLSYPAKFHLAASAAAVTFLLGLAALLVPRRLLGRCAVGGLVVTLILTFSAAVDWYRFDYVARGVVVGEEVIARKGNADGYQPAFTEPLGEGAEFRLVERRDDWLLIRLPGGQEGWVEQAAVVLY